MGSPRWSAGALCAMLVLVLLSPPGVFASGCEDPDPPVTSATLSGTAGANGWWVSSVSVSLSATDADCGVASTVYKLDAGAETTYVTAVTISTDGAHAFRYRSVDNASNAEAWREVAVAIDRVAPTLTTSVSGTYDGFHGWYTSAAEVTASCTDGTSGVAPGGITYVLNGGASQPYAGTLSVSHNGVNTLVVTCVDRAGNSANATRTLRVDTEAPRVLLSVRPTNGDAYDVSYELADDGIGLAGNFVLEEQRGYGVVSEYAPIATIAMTAGAANASGVVHVEHDGPGVACYRGSVYDVLGHHGTYARILLVTVQGKAVAIEGCTVHGVVSSEG